MREMNSEIRKVLQSELKPYFPNVHTLADCSVYRPYLIDLDSANGTTVNEQKVPPSRYYELQPNDLIKFAYSTRECEPSFRPHGSQVGEIHSELTLSKSDVLIVD